MIISHKHKFIFIRPQKVASTSVEMNLLKHCCDSDIIRGPENFSSRYDEEAVDVKDLYFKNANRKLRTHLKPKQIRHLIGKEKWDQFYKFTITRNPWDRYIFYYYWKKHRLKHLVINKTLYALKHPLHSKAKKNCIKQIKQYNRFTRSQNIKKICKRFHGFTPDESGKPFCDYYIRFSHLEEDYKHLCEKLNISYEPLPRYKSKLRKKALPRSYTKKTEKIIGEIFQDEINYFGYKSILEKSQT